MTTRRFYSNYNPIISNPVRSYEDEQRQHHRDIGELPDDQIGYEIVTLTNEFGRAVSSTPTKPRCHAQSSLDAGLWPRIP